MVKATCFKENNKKVEVKNPEYGVNGIGRATVKGICPSCGNSVSTIIKDVDAPDNLRAKMAQIRASLKSTSRKKSVKKGSSQKKSAKKSGKKSAKRSHKK